MLYTCTFSGGTQELHVLLPSALCPPALFTRKGCTCQLRPAHKGMLVLLVIDQLLNLFLTHAATGEE